MSDATDPAALAAQFGLSERGGLATKPSLTFFPQMFAAGATPSTSRLHVSNLCVTEGVLTPMTGGSGAHYMGAKFPLKGGHMPSIGGPCAYFRGFRCPL